MQLLIGCRVDTPRAWGTLGGPRETSGASTQPSSCRGNRQLASRGWPWLVGAPGSRWGWDTHWDCLCWAWWKRSVSVRPALSLFTWGSQAALWPEIPPRASWLDKDRFGVGQTVRLPESRSANWSFHQEPVSVLVSLPPSWSPGWPVGQPSSRSGD